jgi:hypothetical protein
VESITPEATELQGLHDAFVSLLRETKRQSLTLPSEFSDVYYRLQSDVTPTLSVELHEGEIPTNQIVRYLERAYAGKTMPRNKLILLFIECANRIMEVREHSPPAKAEWIRAHLAELVTPEGINLVLGSSANTQAWNQYRQHLSDDRQRLEAISVNHWSGPAEAADMIITSSPNYIFLEDMVCGGARESVFLLYPWEIRRFNRALERLRMALREIGVEDWPGLRSSSSVPMIIEAQASPTESDEIVGPRESGNESEGDSERDDELRIRDDGVPLLTIKLRLEDDSDYSLREGQIVIARRQGVFQDALVESLKVGDLLVVPLGVSNLRAHRILERVCRRRPDLAENLRQATSWKRLLRDWVNAKYAGGSISDVVRDATPPCGYAAFRGWLKGDDPVAPRLDNLRWLYAWIGFEATFAERADEARKRHLRDRRRIYSEMLGMNQGKLSEILELQSVATNTQPAGVNPPESMLPLEDLLTLVAFKTVKQITTVLQP